MELMQLLPLTEDRDYYILTERNVASEETLLKHRHHCFFQQERGSFKFPFCFFINLFLSLIYFARERPTTVITTGAGVVFPTCLLAYLFKCRLIYVESFARLDRKSFTGKLVYPLADYFYVQWPEMLKVYPKAIYMGSVY